MGIFARVHLGFTSISPGKNSLECRPLERKIYLNRFGLGGLKKVSSASKLPEPTYDILICLTWLIKKLRSESKKWEKEEKKQYEQVIRQPNLLIRIFRWIGKKLGF